MSQSPTTTSTRPYLLRAIHQWVVDNGFTPYLLIDASVAGVEVPPESVRDGKVVLNLAPQAVAGLELGNEEVVFLTRFGGVSRRVRVPMAATRAIYAQENGQGMMFADEPSAEDSSDKAGPQPASVETEAAGDGKGKDKDRGDKSSGKPPHLRVIK